MLSIYASEDHLEERQASGVRVEDGEDYLDRLEANYRAEAIRCRA